MSKSVISNALCSSHFCSSIIFILLPVRIRSSTYNTTVTIPLPLTFLYISRSDGLLSSLFALKCSSILIFLTLGGVRFHIVPFSIYTSDACSPFAWNLWTASCTFPLLNLQLQRHLDIHLINGPLKLSRHDWHRSDCVHIRNRCKGLFLTNSFYAKPFATSTALYLKKNPSAL